MCWTFEHGVLTLLLQCLGWPTGRRGSRRVHRAVREENSRSVWHPWQWTRTCCALFGIVQVNSGLGLIAQSAFFLGHEAGIAKAAPTGSLWDPARMAGAAVASAVLTTGRSREQVLPTRLTRPNTADVSVLCERTGARITWMGFSVDISIQENMIAVIQLEEEEALEDETLDDEDLTPH